MIYDSQALKIKYKNYSNINQKISLEAFNGKLVRVKRGLYTDDLAIDAPIISNICYFPSYLSYEYALSYYGLIPESVSVYTSAVFGKKNNKRYQLKGACFEYRSIPDDVYPYGIKILKNENGVAYKMASKEKALCDELYSKYPVRNISDIKMMLFEDLRIDEDELMKLDFEFIKEIAPLYHSNTLLSFVKFFNEELLK
ncbi:MAG: hypothetical protein NC222_08985 [Staphylococcus sp.]|nr:hypothetical protein [Anaeroplasma bactoclasticum]MCM1196072.1 hypothetical protein [Roseburia sp.]MCM1261058.1 hypothetical protein [Staphylococcus sp.]MCM1557421.1 hypothetical protein [Anaeroplasma bactoclasticum]